MLSQHQYPNVGNRTLIKPMTQTTNVGFIIHFIIDRGGHWYFQSKSVPVLGFKSKSVPVLGFKSKSVPVLISKSTKLL